MTPDPIGLEGGINLFSYVQNNPVINIDPRGLMGCSRAPERIENIQTITNLLEAIQKRGSGGASGWLNLLPNPSTTMSRLLDAMSKSPPCREMLLATKCEDFKNISATCHADLEFNYYLFLKSGLDFPGALAEELFERIAAMKESKVCCKK
jgi:hypothetical protein